MLRFGSSYPGIVVGQFDFPDGTRVTIQLDHDGLIYEADEIIGGEMMDRWIHRIGSVNEFRNERERQYQASRAPA